MEAWKRVADRRVGKMLLPLPMHGPALSDKMKKDSVDAICRVTWWLVCDGMTEDEEMSAWRENCDAIEEYAAALAEKAAAERWQRVFGSGWCPGRTLQVCGSRNRGSGPEALGDQRGGALERVVQHGLPCRVVAL